MTAGASKAATTITQPALATSPQSRPAPTRRALPPKLVDQRGQNIAGRMTAWYRADHLQRDGSGNRHRRCVLQRPRLRRLAGPCPQADIDRGPHHPRQDIETRQPLLAGSVRAGGMGGADQAKELGAPRGSNPGLKLPKSGCTTTCWRLRWPINWPVSPGAFLRMDAP